MRKKSRKSPAKHFVRKNKKSGKKKVFNLELHKKIKQHKTFQRKKLNIKANISKTKPETPVKTGFVETSVDKLLELVEKKKSVSLNFAAKFLGYPKAEVEDWAKVLAEHGLLEISYNMFSVILRKKSVKK